MTLPPELADLPFESTDSTYVDAPAFLWTWTGPRRGLPFGLDLTYNWHGGPGNWALHTPFTSVGSPAKLRTIITAGLLTGRWPLQQEHHHETQEN